MLAPGKHYIRRSAALCNTLSAILLFKPSPSPTATPPPEGEVTLPLWGSWHGEAVTERAKNKKGVIPVGTSQEQRSFEECQGAP